MHSAPSVTYPVGRSRFAGALLALAWLLGAAAAGLWWLQSPSPGWRLGALGFVLAAAGAFAAWGWWHGAQGTLAWDGQSWSWSGDPDGHDSVLEVGLDLQRWLLLRWKSGNASHWLWLERTGRLERWDDLRRAVYSRARLDALPDARPPAAKP